MTDTPTYEQLSALCAQLKTALDHVRDNLYVNEYADYALQERTFDVDMIDSALTAYRTLSPDPVYAEAMAWASAWMEANPDWKAPEDTASFEDFMSRMQMATQIEHMLEALEPLSSIPIGDELYDHEDAVIYKNGGKSITVGDVLKARAAITKAKESNK